MECFPPGTRGRSGERQWFAPPFPRGHTCHRHSTTVSNLRPLQTSSYREGRTLWTHEVLTPRAGCRQDVPFGAPCILAGRGETCPTLIMIRGEQSHLSIFRLKGVNPIGGLTLQVIVCWDRKGTLIYFTSKGPTAAAAVSRLQEIRDLRTSRPHG